MKRLRFSSLWNRQSQNWGFTLVEVQLSAALVLGSLLMGGTGVNQMLSASSRAEAQQAQQSGNNRALEFISAEARQIRDILPFVASQDAQDCTKTELVKTFLPEDADALIKQIATLPGKIDHCQPILQMYLSDPTNGELIHRPILYFIASTEGAPWQGPKVVYRWGPDLNGDGEFEAPNDINTWSISPLIDGIDGSSSTKLTPGMEKCPKGWTASPSQKDSPSKPYNATGFYACIEDGDRTAQIFLKGKVAQGKSVIASTKFFTRSVEFKPSPNSGNANTQPTNNETGTTQSASTHTSSSTSNTTTHTSSNSGVSVSINTGLVNTNTTVNGSGISATVDIKCPPGLAKKNKC